MSPRLFDPKEAGYYFTIGQVGMEMAAPAGLGAVLDHYLGWSPWGVIVGAMVGLVGGMAHLLALLNQQQEKKSSPPKDLP